MIKKLLFLFVASIIGIISVWADATTMPFSPTSGAYYSLKEKTTGLYVNIVESSDHRKDVVLGNAAEAFTFVFSGSSYTIKNISGDYIGKYTNNWNMDSRTAENWTIIDAGNGEIKLSCDKGQVGLDSYTAGSAFYRDKSSGCTFVVEEMQEEAPETYLYTINFVASNGNKYMLSVNENTGALETTAYTSTPSAAQIFKFNHWSNGKYSILHGDKYLGYDRLYTEFNKSLNYWEVLPLEGVSNSLITSTVPAGSVYLRVGQRSSTNSMIGVLIVSNTTGAMNSSTSPYFNDSYTSAILLEEVELQTQDYTLRVTGAPTGTVVNYKGEPYEDGDVITVSGPPSVRDFTPAVIDHYSSSVSIDNENKIITITYKVQIDVNYRIYVDGTLVDTKVVTEIQGEPTTFTLEHPDYVSVTGIPSVVTEATVDVYTTQTLPFVPGDAHFYNLKIKHGTSYPVIYVNPNDGVSLKTIADIAVTFENQNYFQWSFVGNWYTGFALLNKQTQRYVSFGSASPEDDTHAVLVETPGEGSYFDIVQNSGDNYLKIHGTTDSYINQYGGNATYLTNWNSPRNIGDNGSKIEISEAEQITSDQDYRDALALAQAELQRAESLPALFTEQAFTDAEDAIAAIAYDAADKASVDNAIAELTGIMKNFRASAAGRYIALLSDDSFNTRGADYYLTSGNTSTERMTATPTIQVESVFTLAYDADQNDYTIQTALSGQYLPVLAGSSTPIYTSAEAGHYTIVPQGEENRILLTNVEKKNVANNGGVHIDASANIVVWGSTIAASHWIVVPVSQEEYDDLCLYHVTIHINNPAGTVEIGGTTYHDGDSFVQDSPIETSDVQPAPIQGCEVSVSLPHTARTIAVVCCYYTPYEISQCGTPTEVRYWADADHEHMQQTAYVPGHTIINLSMYGEGEPGEQHTLHYQVLDDKGNVSPVRSISYIYDKHQQVIVLEEWEVLKRFHDASMMQGEWTRNVWSMEEGRGETADESLEHLPGVSLVDGHVRSIDLSQSGITGDVLSLAELPELEHLNLSGNAIANVELPLIRETATANLRNQTITDTKNIVWDAPTEQSLTENLPNIMRISADARSLAEQYTWTLWNAPTATGWRMSLVMKDAMPELRQVSSRIYDNANGGNATLQVASGVSAGTTLPVQFFHLDGDANLSGTVDVLDVQTVVNESFGIGNGFLNKQAADLQPDGSLNVLDLVRVVNVLLAQEMSSQSATTRHMAKAPAQHESYVFLECTDGSLLLESSERVGALDLWLRLPQGSTEDDVENLLAGFDVATRLSGNLCHVVLYSPMGIAMDGMGEALLSLPQGTTLLRASAADAEANSLSVSMGQTTGIVDVTAPREAATGYDLQGRLSIARGLHITRQRGKYTKSLTK